MSAKAISSCQSDHPDEISFQKGQLIVEVENSKEVGWLVGTVQDSGQRGLFPENYVAFLDSKGPADPTKQESVIPTQNTQQQLDEDFEAKKNAFSLMKNDLIYPMKANAAKIVSSIDFEEQKIALSAQKKQVTPTSRNTKGMAPITKNFRAFDSIDFEPRVNKPIASSLVSFGGIDPSKSDTKLSQPEKKSNVGNEQVVIQSLSKTANAKSVFENTESSSNPVLKGSGAVSGTLTPNKPVPNRATKPTNSVTVSPPSNLPKPKLKPNPNTKHQIAEFSQKNAKSSPEPSNASLLNIVSKESNKPPVNLSAKPKIALTPNSNKIKVKNGADGGIEDSKFNTATTINTKPNPKLKPLVNYTSKPLVSLSSEKPVSDSLDNKPNIVKASNPTITKNITNSLQAPPKPVSLSVRQSRNISTGISSSNETPMTGTPETNVSAGFNTTSSSLGQSSGYPNTTVGVRGAKPPPPPPPSKRDASASALSAPALAPAPTPGSLVLQLQYKEKSLTPGISKPSPLKSDHITIPKPKPLEPSTVSLKHWSNSSSTEEVEIKNVDSVSGASSPFSNGQMDMFTNRFAQLKASKPLEVAQPAQNGNFAEKKRNEASYLPRTQPHVKGLPPQLPSRASLPAIRNISNNNEILRSSSFMTVHNGSNYSQSQDQKIHGSDIKLPRLTSNRCRLYAHLFRKNDKKKMRSLDYSLVMSILDKPGLQSADLKQIWALADSDKDGVLSLPEFILAMWLADFFIEQGFLPDNLVFDDIQTAYQYRDTK